MFKQEFMSEAVKPGQGSKNLIEFAKLYDNFKIDIVNAYEKANGWDTKTKPKDIKSVDRVIVNTKFLRFIVNIEFYNSVESKKELGKFEVTWYIDRDKIEGEWLQG